MTNIYACSELHSLADSDYSAQFQRGDQVQAPQIQRIGESIPKDKNGAIKYTTSLTPIL
jgi:hypothetical protein